MTGFVVAVVCLVVMAVLCIVLEWRSRIKDPRVTGLCPDCGEKLRHEPRLEPKTGFYCPHCLWVDVMEGRKGKNC